MSESVGGAEGGKDSPGVGGEKDSGGFSESGGAFDSALSEASSGYGKDPGGWDGDKGPDPGADRGGKPGGGKPDALADGGSWFDGGAPKDAPTGGSPSLLDVIAAGLAGQPAPLAGPPAEPARAAPPDLLDRLAEALAGRRPVDDEMPAQVTGWGWSATGPAPAPPAPETPGLSTPGPAAVVTGDLPESMLGLLGAGSWGGGPLAGGAEPIVVPAFYQGTPDPFPPVVGARPAPPVLGGGAAPIAPRPVPPPGPRPLVPVPPIVPALPGTRPVEHPPAADGPPVIPIRPGAVIETPWNTREETFASPELGGDLRLRGEPGSRLLIVEGIRDGRWTMIGRAETDGRTIRILQPERVAEALGRPLPTDTLRIEGAGDLVPAVPPAEPGFGVETRTQEEADLVAELRARGASPAEILNALWGLRNGLPRVEALSPPAGAPPGTLRYRVGENELTAIPRPGGGYDLEFTIRRDYGDLPRSPAVRAAQEAARARGEEGDVGFHTGAHRFFPGLTETILPGDARLNVRDWRTVENDIARETRIGNLIEGSVRALPSETVRPREFEIQYDVRTRDGDLVDSFRQFFPNGRPDGRL